MKKILSLLMVALLSVSTWATEVALNGRFSVDANGSKVAFSPGNLQYQASTDTWRFAPSQYTILPGLYNEQRSATFAQWIDMFYWGKLTAPWAQDDTDWNEWGTLMSTEDETWRTMTAAEWNYLFNGRPNADSLHSRGRITEPGVVNMQGMILLPDDWTLPEGLTFTPDAAYAGNIYNQAQWTAMEAAGAVFLPAAGFMESGTYNYGNTRGWYWSKTFQPLTNDYPTRFYTFHFDYDETVTPYAVLSSYDAASVRLVKQVELPTVSYATEKNLTGMFTVNDAGDRISFSQGAMQYNAMADTWQFAQEQYDFIGLPNTEIDPNNYNWIDLFGWGTGANPTNRSKSDADYATFTDWTTNPIHNGGNNTWRLLTPAEWDYLFHTRAHAHLLTGWVKIGDIDGHILLPDNWDCINKPLVSTYTLDEWAVLEAEGAVFLPASGRREGMNVTLDYYASLYWTPEVNSDTRANCLWYAYSVPQPLESYPRHFGGTVRPVKDVTTPREPVQYAQEKALKGLFTINSDYQRVRLAQGNLQYYAPDSVWQFAEQQYEVLGIANKYTDYNYYGWIDLFDFGAGADPTRANSDARYFDNDFYTEFGVNPIHNGGNTPDAWRTLSLDEWKYLLNFRDNAEKLFGMGSIDGHNGVILLPDNWLLIKPENVSFTPATELNMDWQSSPIAGYIDNNSEANHYTDNVYTLDEWAVMEAAGAVFLPVGGERTAYAKDRSVNGLNVRGKYWTSTVVNERYALPVEISCRIVWTRDSERSDGGSVRLAQDVAPNDMTAFEEVYNEIAVFYYDIVETHPELAESFYEAITPHLEIAQNNGSSQAEVDAAVEALRQILQDTQNSLTEGIETIHFTNENATYNVLGQRVGADYHGLVIRNGKKQIR